MFDFHQKRRMRTVFASRVTQGILLLVAFFVLLSAYNRYLIAREMADRREAVESEISALESRKASMEAEVKYLSNERGIEAEMRRQFDIALDSEQVVIILEDETTATAPAAAATTTKRAWYKFW